MVPPNGTTETTSSQIRRHFRHNPDATTERPRLIAKFQPVRVRHPIRLPARTRDRPYRVGRRSTSRTGPATSRAFMVRRAPRSAPILSRSTAARIGSQPSTRCVAHHEMSGPNFAASAPSRGRGPGGSWRSPPRATVPVRRPSAAWRCSQAPRTRRDRPARSPPRPEHQGQTTDSRPFLLADTPEPARSHPAAQADRAHRHRRVRAG